MEEGPKKGLVVKQDHSRPQQLMSKGVINT